MNNNRYSNLYSEKPSKKSVSNNGSSNYKSGSGSAGKVSRDTMSLPSVSKPAVGGKHSSTASLESQVKAHEMKFHPTNAMKKSRGSYKAGRDLSSGHPN